MHIPHEIIKKAFLSNENSQINLTRSNKELVELVSKESCIQKMKQCAAKSQ